jgi:hypothetical protein
MLRTLLNELRGTLEPSRELLATSLDVIVRSIASSQGKLNSISGYRARMFEFYKTELDRNQVRDLGISKQSLMSLSIDPRTRQQTLVNKKHICIDWCIHPQFNDNLMDRWFMVFDKPPWNNKEVVPLYFLSKLWE